MTQYKVNERKAVLSKKTKATAFVLGGLLGIWLGILVVQAYAAPELQAQPMAQFVSDPQVPAAVNLQPAIDATKAQLTCEVPYSIAYCAPLNVQ